MSNHDPSQRRRRDGRCDRRAAACSTRARRVRGLSADELAPLSRGGTLGFIALPEIS
jgi:hypothetical protein